MRLDRSLRIALAMANMTNRELARRIEVNPQLITNWLRSGVINHKNIKAICKVLEMPVSEFIALGE